MKGAAGFIHVVGRMLVAAAVLVGVVWSFLGVAPDLGHMHQGLIMGWRYFLQMVPQSRLDWRSDAATLGDVWKALLQTLQMAIAGTVLGAIPAIPISFLAARTTSLFRPLAWTIKTFLNIGRAVPILVWALFIIAAIGLGAPAGALAVGVGSFVMLSKLYAEALESVSPGPVEAVRAVGGNPAQVFVYGMLPQAFPNYLSATLYALELNLQASFILGIVGAGGIGFELQNDIRLYNMLDVGVLVLLLIVLVNLVDYVSYVVRRTVS